MHANNMQNDIKKMTEEGKLQSLLHQLRTELNQAYAKKFAGKLKDTNSIKRIKKNIARVLMQINKVKKTK